MIRKETVVTISAATGNTSIKIDNIRPHMDVTHLSESFSLPSYWGAELLYHEQKLASI